MRKLEALRESGRISRWLSGLLSADRRLLSIQEEHPEGCLRRRRKRSRPRRRVPSSWLPLRRRISVSTSRTQPAEVRGSPPNRLAFLKEAGAESHRKVRHFGSKLGVWRAFFGCNPVSLPQKSQIETGAVLQATSESHLESTNRCACRAECNNPDLETILNVRPGGCSSSANETNKQLDYSFAAFSKVGLTRFRCTS